MNVAVSLDQLGELENERAALLGVGGAPDQFEQVQHVRLLPDEERPDRIRALAAVRPDLFGPPRARVSLSCRSRLCAGRGSSGTSRGFARGAPVGPRSRSARRARSASRGGTCPTTSSWSVPFPLAASSRLSSRESGTATARSAAPARALADPSCAEVQRCAGLPEALPRRGRRVMRRRRTDSASAPSSFWAEARRPARVGPAVRRRSRRGAALVWRRSCPSLKSRSTL